MISSRSSSYRHSSMSASSIMLNTSVLLTLLILSSASRISFSIHNDDSGELLYTSTITHTSPALEDFTTDLQNVSVCRTAENDEQWAECVKLLETHLNKDSKEYSQLQDIKDSFEIRGQSPLPQVAAIRGYTELIEVLLHNGVPINKKYTSFEETMLHHSAKNGHNDLTTLLLTQGADIQVKNWFNDTPLNKAVSRFHLTTVKLLLEAGADVNTINMVEQTPIFQAVNNLKLPESMYRALNSKEVAEVENSRYVIGKDIIKLLLEHGADTNIASYTRRTPLHVAAENGILTIVQLLIDGGGNINATNIDNQTPLHKATESNNVSVVQYLVAMGCDKTVTDIRKRTALDIAKKKNLTEIIDLLSGENIV